jgi:glycosyltransferase involved in cell wall biosynthesis
MKIAHFLGTFKKEDGVTRVLLSLINEAQKKEIESIIVTGWAEDESITTAPVIQIHSFAFPLYREYKLALPGISGFEKKLDEFHPDIIHVHSPESIAWAAVKYAKKNKIPIVATYHTNFCRYLNYYYLSSLEPFIWDILKRLYKKMNFVTSPSATVSQELVELGIKNVYTIPWGVDSKKFNNSFRSQKWRDKILGEKSKIIILYVGRLAWFKDLRILAETFKLLKSKRNDFEMVIAGDGPAKQELELLMPGSIFLGHIEGKELSEVYASSDFLLTPSCTEVFANVPLEAISSGIIPIIADIGGMKVLVENKKICLLCKPKDVQDFFIKTNSLLNNHKLQEEMKINGQNFIKDFTPEKVFNEMLEKYLALLK